MFTYEGKTRLFIMVLQCCEQAIMLLDRLGKITLIEVLCDSEKLNLGIETVVQIEQRFVPGRPGKFQMKFAVLDEQPGTAAYLYLITALICQIIQISDIIFCS